MKSSTLNSTLAFLGCGLLALTLPGCGGDSSDTSSSSSSSNPTATAPTAPQVAAGGGGGGAAAGGATTPDMYGAGGGGADADMYSSENYGTDPGLNPGLPGGPQNAGPKVPSRPKDPADWNEQQIRAGIEERDKQAPGAIAAYAAKIEGDEAAVSRFVSYIPILSEPPRKPVPANGYNSGGAAGYQGEPGAEGYTPDESLYVPDPGDTTPESYTAPDSDMYGSGGSARQQTVDQQIAQTLVESIIKSHTLVGYQTARGLLQGDVPTGQSAELVAGWTLSALMKSFSGSNLDPAQKILLQSLSKADVLRPEGGDFDASKLEKTSLVLHAADAISIIDGLMGLSTTEQLGLKKQNGNAMYGSGSDPSEMYSGADAAGGGYSGADGSGGGPGKLDVKPEIPPVPKDFPVTDFSSTQSLNASKYLWSQEMITFVTGRLGESDTLMKTPELVLLAGQIPHSSTRQGLKKFFEKNWQMTDEWTRNPAPLLTEKVLEKYMRDPGLLLTLKSLPREQPPQGQTSGGDQYGAEGPGAITGTGPRPTTNRSKPDNKSAEQKVAKEAWFDATQQVMLAWMDRATKGAGGGISSYNPEELPFKLHRNAEPSKSFRLELSSGSGEQQEVTTLNYVRVDLPSDISSNQARIIAKFYDTAMKRGEEYKILGNNAIWYDWVSTDKHTGQIVSTDVVLSSNGARKLGGRGQQGGADYAQPGGEGGAAQQLAVEILVIRVSDPDAKIPAGAVSQR